MQDALTAITQRVTKRQVEKMAYSLGELAAAISVSPAFLRLEIHRGRLRASRLGRRLVVTRSEALAYLRASELS